MAQEQSTAFPAPPEPGQELPFSCRTKGHVWTGRDHTINANPRVCGSCGTRETEAELDRAVKDAIGSSLLDHGPGTPEMTEEYEVYRDETGYHFTEGHPANRRPPYGKIDDEKQAPWTPDPKSGETWQAYAERVGFDVDTHPRPPMWWRRKAMELLDPSLTKESPRAWPGHTDSPEPVKADGGQGKASEGYSEADVLAAAQVFARAAAESLGGPSPDELMARWWLDTAQDDLDRLMPKVQEYGSADLRIMAAAMMELLRSPWWQDDDTIWQAGYELAVLFYQLGKVARGFGAYCQGKLPSDDTLTDNSVYAKMLRRVREVGQWP